MQQPKVRRFNERLTNPASFVACGSMAQSAIVRLQSVASQLQSTLRGQIGFASISHDVPQDSALATRRHRIRESVDARKVSPLGGDEQTQDTDGYSCIALFDEMPTRPIRYDPPEPLHVGLRRMARRLRPANHNSVHESPTTPWLDVYLLVDAYEPSCVDTALKAVEALFAETSAIEITAILFSGRAAEQTRDVEASLQDGLRRFATANGFKQADDVDRNASTRDDRRTPDGAQRDARGSASPLLHRAFLIDGQNARGEWAVNGDELVQCAAEFIFHHGLSPYRHKLRQRERSRLSPKQDFPDVLGSFACRIIATDTENISPAVTRALIDQGLFGDEERPLSQDERAEIQAICAKLEAKLLKLFKGNAYIDSAIQQADSSAATADELTDNIEAIISEAIEEVCQRDPLRRIYGFLRKLEDVLARLQLQLRVLERTSDRQRVASKLRPQLLRVHEAASRSRTRSRDPRQQASRATAEVKKQSAEVPPQPANYFWVPLTVPKKRCYLGLAIVAVGVAVGLLARESFLWPLAVAPIAIFAGVFLLDAPRRFWKNIKVGDTWVGERDVSTERIQQLQFKPTDKRKSNRRVFRGTRPQWRLFLGYIVSIAGVALVASCFAFDSGDAPTVVEMAVVGGIAALAIMAAAIQTSNVSKDAVLSPVSGKDGKGPLQDEGLLDRHRVGSKYPIAYFPLTKGWWRPFWLFVLAIAVGWLFVRWNTNFRVADFAWPIEIAADQWAPTIARVGVLITALGLVCVAWPSKTSRDFSKRIRIPPEPIPNLEDIYGRLPISANVDAAVGQLRDWIGSLLASIQNTNRRSRKTNQPNGNESGPIFLDFVADDWPTRFADLCYSWVQHQASDPRNWSDYVLQRRGRVRHSAETRHQGLGFQFALQLVDRWFAMNIESVGWKGLISRTRPDPNWLGRFFDRAMAPMWPVNPRHVEVELGLAAIDADLQAAAAFQGIGTHSRWQVCEIDWPETDHRQHRVALIHVVQGISTTSFDSLLSGFENA